MTRSRQVPAKKARALRCAIYTRVSTDHGLDQDFNSLDAQREACEAYVRSQTHEGWTLVRDRFDDGGFSGGSLERPALTRLLALVDAGRVDVIVVYKVDRLTRSLADFAKLVERFDAKTASFVSITQSFNSTSSMGRLTLNMLLSFAQFEREVTGERIRDKIAASKRKGIWVGGNPSFGYIVKDRKLVIDEAEANVVRSMFERYLALGSLDALLRELRLQEVRTRIRTLSSGKTRGGVFFGRGALASLLRNRIYLGELRHHGESYPAEHCAILDGDLFDRVQDRLTGAAVAFGQKRASESFLLRGLLFDDRGYRMTPSAVRKKGRQYRYYISRALSEGARDRAGSAPRIAAAAVEDAITHALAAVTDQHDRKGSDEPNRIETFVGKIVTSRTTLTIDLTPDAADVLGRQQIVTAWDPKSTKVRRDALQPDLTDVSPMRTDRRADMLVAIARGRTWLSELQSNKAIDVEAIAVREKRSPRSVLMTISLAFLAPQIVQAIVDRRLPRGVGLAQLYDLPADWTAQTAMLGVQAT